MKTKVLVTHPLIEGGLDLLFQHYQVEIASHCNTSEELVPFMEDVDALIPLLSVKIDEHLLSYSKKLKIIANYAVGYDNIDIPAATRRGIWVTNTPGVLTEATADLTWAGLLALVRHVVPGDAMMQAGRYTGWGPTLLLGFELAGATLGIVGLGKIGSAVARRAIGFSMQVIFCDPAIEGDVEMEKATARKTTLEKLLLEADIISLHTPLTTETFHLLDAARLNLLKPTAYIINTSRGAVIDEKALVECIRAGKIAGAALDVYEREPALAPGLKDLSNVLLLPHIGSATHKTRLLMAKLAAENVHAALTHRRPPNALNDPHQD